MGNALVYISAIAFALALFPIHIFNYVYVDSGDRYASLNVCIFRYIKLFNVNTVKDKPNHMMVNGKDKEVSFGKIKANMLGVLNRLHFLKVIQLGDYGVLNGSSAYAALVQRSASNFLYALAQTSGSTAKLRNFTVLNQTTDGIRYYAKIEIAINAISIARIIIYLISEKIK